MALKQRMLTVSLVKCLIDFLVIAACLWLGVALVYLCVNLLDNGSMIPSIGVVSRIIILTCVVCLLGYSLAGLYPGYGLSNPERLRLYMCVTTVIFLIMAIFLSWLQKKIGFLVVATIALGITAFMLPLVNTLIYPLLSKSARWGKPVLLSGSDSSVTLLTKILEENREFGFIPVQVNSSNTPGSAKTSSPPDYLDIDTILLITSSEHDKKTTEVNSGTHSAKRVVTVHLSPEKSRLWMHLGNLQGAFTLNATNHPDTNGYPMIKAILDRVLGFILLVAFTPVITLLARKVKKSDSGSPFYSQARVGYQGKEVKIQKLRTMRMDAQEILQKLLAEDPAAKLEWEKYYKLKNDPRIIGGVGEFLRKYSLDELPQFYNVIRGDISLVGPRPFPQYHMDSFSKEFSAFRTSVMPGLTGLWQICVRSDGGIEVQEAVDTYYIEHRTVWMDIDILFNTISCVIMAKGAH